MPRLSERGDLMPDSPIRKLVPFADKAKEMGRKVYHLNIGQPDLPTPEVALQAIRNIDRKILEYSPSDGIKSYREKLATYYHRFNINVTANDIIITSGGSEAVTFAFLACLDPGDEIIVPEPAYANYTAFAILAGAVIKSIPSKIEEGFALPPMEEFEKLITPKTKGIMICNPKQPDRIFIYPHRNEQNPGPGKEIRPVSVFGRSLPGILLHRGALHFGIPSGRN
jgi:aspartate aminotransferase